MPEGILVVAVAQTSAEPGDVSANANAAADLIAEAADNGAKLMMFPELSLVGYDLDGLASSSAWVAEDDSRLDVVRQASRDHGVTAVIGAAYRWDDGRAWLASLTARPDGELHVHGKRYLHGKERELFQPGGHSQLLDIEGWKVALAICYDAGVPSHAQDAAAQGADLYAASSLYTMDEVRRIDIHLAARAMDHRMFAAVANYAGIGPGWESCGGSGVWHPDGRRITQAGTEPGVFCTALPYEELKALRDKDAAAGYPRG